MSSTRPMRAYVDWSATCARAATPVVVALAPSSGFAGPVRLLVPEKLRRRSFTLHPMLQTAVVTKTDPGHPATFGLPDKWLSASARVVRVQHARELASTSCRIPGAGGGRAHLRPEEDLARPGLQTCMKRRPPGAAWWQGYEKGLCVFGHRAGAQRRDVQGPEVPGSPVGLSVSRWAGATGYGMPGKLRRNELRRP